MDGNQHNVLWEHRQAELWDRIFQVTQDVVTLADSMEGTSGGAIMRDEMVKSAMDVGKYLVRATAADNNQDFQRFAQESRLKAIETDYWLRLAYIIQQREDVQRDVSSVITQYSSIVDLLHKMVRHIEERRDSSAHKYTPKVNLG